MGLFDKVKEKVGDMAVEFKANVEEASQMEIYELCNAMKEMKMLDKKLPAYSSVLNSKCKELGDTALEDLYKQIKKDTPFLKTHHAKAPIETVLIERNMYIRNEDGTVSRNMLYRNRS